VASAVVPGAVVNSDLLPRHLPFLPSERGDESLKPPSAAHGAGFLIEVARDNQDENAIKLTSAPASSMFAE
jgi:hypothetical protein